MNIRLDNRVIEGKMPLTWFDADKAKEFIGKTGYFSDNLICFKNIDNLKVDILTGVDNDLNEEEIYQTNTTRWIYFLPDEWVKPKEPEKRYRPFSLEEFLYIFGMGDRIDFKKKNDDEVKCAMFTGYITDDERIDVKTPGAVELMLGCFHYSLFSLFEDFELSYNGEWQPFGKEIEE